MRAHRVLIAVQSILWVGLAVSVCVSAEEILQAGLAARASDAAAVAYTPEAVGAAAPRTLALFVLALVGSVACKVLGVKASVAKGVRDGEVDCARELAFAGELTPEMRREEALQRNVRLIGYAGAALFFLRAFILAYFELIRDEAASLRPVLPNLTWACVWLLAGVFLIAATSYVRDKSIRREIELVRAGGSARGVRPPKRRFGTSRAPRVLRYILVVVALYALGLGVVTGGAESVLNKAIIVCTECIGLG